MSTTADKVSGDLQMNPELRKSFNLLKTHAAKVANFTLQWQDLEEHVIAIDESIQSKLDQFEQQQKLPISKDTQLTATIQSLKTQFNPPETGAKPEDPKPESLTSNGVPIHDGKALLFYLNEHLKDRESVRGHIANALKVSVDPGKLVLEAVRWFYPSEGEKMEVEMIVVRKSCVLLLEEVVKVGPVIKPEIREESMMVALGWKAKVGGHTTNSLEVWGFLQLLGAFGLVGEFGSDEILKLVGCVAERKHAPELFRSLGFADKAADFIEKLVSENKRLDAVRFIYAFELLEKFPPVPLLKAHLTFAKKDVRMSGKKGQDRLKAQDEAGDKEIIALRGTIRCIDDYKLSVEPQYSPETLRKRINQLKRQKKERKSTLTTPGSEAHVQQLSGKKRTAPDFKAQPNKQNRNKHLRAAPAPAAQNVSFREPVSVHSIQSSYLRQPAGLYDSRGAEYFMSSAGRLGQKSTPPNTSYGTTCTYNSLRASYHPQGGSFLGQGAEYSAGYYDSTHSVPDTHSNLTARHYGLVGSSPVTQTQQLSLTGRDYELTGTSHVHMNSAMASYGLDGSSHVTSHRSPLARRYGTSIAAANGRTGQFASAGSPPPVRGISNGSPKSAIPYVSRDPLRMPNYNERSGSSSSGYGTLSQCPPSIYHL